MKADEFAFLNQQLAGMLKSGIPLEGSLRQLSATLRRGRLRDELEKLEADLRQGTPLPDALADRQMPPLYTQMLQVGAQGNDLPGVLTLLADYYERLHALGARLKGLMVYPAIVLAAAFALSVGLTLLFSRLADTISVGVPTFRPDGATSHAFNVAALWLAPGLLALLTGLLLAGLAIPGWRAGLRWRLPGFKEARLSQLASALGMLLQRGGNLNQALDLVRQLEGDSAAGRELGRWQARLKQGHGRITEFAADGKFFPPLFIWLVASGGEDLAAGFSRAAEIYYARAIYRVEMVLYAFLPVSILLLGMMILGQMFPVLQAFRSFNDSMFYVE